MTSGISRLPAIAVLTLAAGLAIVPGLAKAQEYRRMNCEDLWYARNEIYAEKGYCFKTQRARAEFGRGCFPPYGKLSRYEANEVAEIERWEMRKGCR